MAKDPAFLFYPNDYIGGTMGMTFEQKGAYMEVLMMQFNRGHMDAHMIGQEVGQIWETIKSKFIQDEKGLYYNQRLDIEIKKRKAFIESRKNNISGINQHTKKTENIDGHKTTHMENRNSISFSNEEIERIYKKYPTKCIVSGRSTGKGEKNKQKIATLLKTHTADDLINRIDFYVDDCKKTNTYMKNFATFLNNLPDIDTPEKQKETFRWRWDGQPEKTGTKEEMFRDLNRMKGGISFFQQTYPENKMLYGT